MARGYGSMASLLKRLDSRGRSGGGSRSAAVKKAWQTRKRGGAGAVVKPRRILMADGTYRVGGKVALPKGVGRMDRNGRVMRSSTIGGMLIRFKE